MATSETLDRLEPVGVDDLEQASRRGEADGSSAAQCTAERSAIASRRERHGLAAPTDDNLVGLALSGGGIRSATFSLGVLQALARHDLLKHVDYLSTVSGGGYIGTSLLWWLSGRSGRKFGVGPWNNNVPEAECFPYGTDDPSEWRDRAGQADGPRLLRNLKENGNYLTPGHGINAMSLTAVVLRGVVLNLLFWVPMLAMIFGVLIAVHGYRAALWLAIGLAGVLVLAALVYSLITGHAALGRRLGYPARRWAEGLAGLAIAFLLVVAVVASIDIVHGSIVEQATTGFLSGLGGLVAGLVTYFRTMRSAAGSVRKLPGVTTSLLAIVATVLIIYGVLLFSHGLAEIAIAWGWAWWGLLVAVLLLAASVWTNINHVSAHRMYRDRLMEAFMPGFKDALKGQSRAAPAEADNMRMHEVDLANSPYPIVNTNLLLIGSKERRRKLRGGDSFVLTPKYCGSNATGWVDCRVLMDDRMTLPTAMAISGAAANPNTGAGGVGLTRSRVIAVLMAFIGLRLGYWLPNFGHARPPTWLPNHVWPGLSTVLPLGHTEDSWFLELSDGGHFENLGLYELVRRRVRLIILCDGGQDPDFAFEDLQIAQRRIAADFGATLDFDADTLETLIPHKTDHRFPESDLKLADAGHILGTIRYSDGSTGTLVYLKTTLIERLPLALLGYRGANGDFPDQSTTDQFFDEEQFDSYRELGYIIATRMMEDGDVQKGIEATLGGGAKWDAPKVAAAATKAGAPATRSRPSRTRRTTGEKAKEAES
jgi:hypothetical protein